MLHPPPPRVSIQVGAAKLADSIQEEGQKKQIWMDSFDFLTIRSAKIRNSHFSKFF
jgi:hypothetical protein